MSKETSDFLMAERPPSTETAVTVDSTSSASSGLTLSWKDLGYTIKDKTLLSGLNGCVEPGQVLAVMGPSGAGKSTFLDVVAGRKGKVGSLYGQVLLNGTQRAMKKYSSYVTQDDSLIGCFTVRETIRYAVELGQPISNKKVREDKVQELLAQFGLVKCADSPVGDAIIRGISGGEKRRLSIAVQLVKEPKIIFLDEPTSGLDSAASFKVMEAIRDMARRRKCTIVCSIHQPSPSTYALFDKVLFLARGNTVYYGPTNGIEAEYFKSVGHEIPVHSNVPDAVLDHINVDFLGDEELANTRIDHFVKSWTQSAGRVESISSVDAELKKAHTSNEDAGIIVGGGDYTHGFLKQVEILTRRNFQNALKNILLFWVRLAMYLAMAILMGTTWLRMSDNQNTVQDRFSAIFFTIAFLAFMSVAGIPAVLEERAVFYRERMNRTYSVGAYVIANTLVSMPFVLIIAVGFSIPAYWLMGMNSGASNFFVFIAYLWLALYVAESMVILLAAIFPIFVAALTLASFFNGLEMVTQGYFVRRQNIPAFWKYVFHYWNYQKWSWEALIANEFVGLTFQCNPNPVGGGCFCSIPSSLGPDACKFTGEDVIAEYGYGDYSYWKSAVCLIALIVFFRLAFYVTLRVKKPKV
ncbi:putative ABC transporter [Rhizoclosmatium globosum]|uniref:Putative ABC transporter n=1 Tax=Rhizoclosmatium globosum TaxID=329046 RepID=A0A1Y2B3T6_9FUNG|nr:putative ABC transporter [Rhizoclosmatium globosum]|eukprot:ORY29493.1 putative ABC transporter [Rhizoclosmatium globosum]